MDFIVRPYALGDVPDNAGNTQLSVHRYRSGGDIRLEDGAILSLHWEPCEVDFAFELPIELSGDVGEVFPGMNVIHRQIEKLVAAVAEHAANRLIGHPEPSGLDVSHADSV